MFYIRLRYDDGRIVPLYRHQFFDTARPDAVFFNQDNPETTTFSEINEAFTVFGKAIAQLLHDSHTGKPWYEQPPGNIELVVSLPSPRNPLVLTSLPIPVVMGKISNNQDKETPT